ncbi:MAG: class I SAM-dependent methyltransferase [Candidatus Uhrbacteria bacterium]|nr:class I SAM-dependent methyltransferase [Candidatus Uhrbacteria bacterium]
MPRVRPRQFGIREHYDVMSELDRDVHDDEPLARSEVSSTLRLMANVVPRSLLLPCCGTGRHAAQFLERGVERLVGVDLSPECLNKARQQVSKSRWPNAAHFIETDLRSWDTDEKFDAAAVLGNSFADVIERDALREVTVGMVRLLRRGAFFIMDYIGRNYLDRCGHSSSWQVVFDGKRATDCRTPRYDPVSQVMTIDVIVTDNETGRILWEGFYQKLVLMDAEVVAHFDGVGVDLRRVGVATDLHPAYYAGHDPNALGMIARSTWWVGIKR